MADDKIDHFSNSEAHQRIMASRQLLDECRKRPNPDQLLCVETERQFLHQMMRQVPETKREEVAELERLYAQLAS